MDPLTCPKCSGKMKVISVIEDQEVIKKILKHLGLWEVKPRPPPTMAKSQPLYTEPYIDHSHRGVGPYGPEADTQVYPSDNGSFVDLYACNAQAGPAYPADLLPSVKKSRGGLEGDLRLLSPENPVYQ